MRAAGGDANARYAWDAPGKSTGKLPDAQRQEIILARTNVEESKIGGTTPVAMYPDGVRVTEKGEEIWDLAGNVWEWTRTLYETKDWRAAWIRGGSWYNNYKVGCVSARYNWNRRNDYPDFGFRVCAQ